MAAVGPDRYGMHDLLRAYAGTLAHEEITPTGRSRARRRLLDHYLHSAHAAAALLDHRDPVTLPAPGPGAAPVGFADRDGALAWFAAEHPTLLAAIDAADDTRVGLLARTMSAYLELRGHWPDWVATQHAALDAAHRLADRPGVAAAHAELGRANARMGRYQEAERLLRRAALQFGELGDPLGQGHCHNTLTLVFERRNDFPRALEQATLALAKYRAADNPVGEARALNNMGWCNARLGRYAEAAACCERALARQREVGDHGGESATWDTLGFVHHSTGDHRQAIACYRRARALYRESGDRFNEASLLSHLGDAAHAAGDTDTAQEAWGTALDILTELGR